MMRNSMLFTCSALLLFVSIQSTASTPLLLLTSHPRSFLRLMYVKLAKPGNEFVVKRQTPTTCNRDVKKLEPSFLRRYLKTIKREEPVEKRVVKFINSSKLIRPKKFHYHFFLLKAGAKPEQRTDERMTKRQTAASESLRFLQSHPKFVHQMLDLLRHGKRNEVVNE